MIKLIKDKENIIRLWHEAFHDSVEDIKFFINNVRHAECFGYFEGDKAVSMLYLVDGCYRLTKCGYIYAACTEKKSRGSGYMASLLEYCKENCNYNLCLIPANEGLIDYYKSHGLCTFIDINDISFDEDDEICEYLFEGCELDNPIGLLYCKGD